MERSKYRIRIHSDTILVFDSDVLHVLLPLGSDDVMPTIRNRIARKLNVCLKLQIFEFHLWLTVRHMRYIERCKFKVNVFCRCQWLDTWLKQDWTNCTHLQSSCSISIRCKRNESTETENEIVFDNRFDCCTKSMLNFVRCCVQSRTMKSKRVCLTWAVGKFAFN